MMKLPSMIILYSVMFFGLFGLGNVYGQTTNGVEVDVSYHNGDRVDVFEMHFVVHDLSSESIQIIEPSSNPYMLDTLEPGKSYRIEVYVNNMIGDFDTITATSQFQEILMSIPASSGFRVNVFHSDGKTPVSDATVSVSSHDDKHWRDGITGKDGYTMRFWMQPSTNVDEFYKIHVSIGDKLEYSPSVLNLTPSTSFDFKIITDWPSSIDQLLVESFLNSTQKISQFDGNYFVELIDEDNVLVSKAKVNRGDSVFTNLKIGEYVFRLIEKQNNVEKILTTERIFVSGFDNKIKLVSTQSKTDTDLIDDVEIEPILEECNCVAFRLDDVQDWWLAPSQQQIIDTFYEKEIPITLGIVGGHFGQDESMVNFLLDKLSSNEELIEIANHSWNDDRLTQMTLSEQINVITSAHNEITKNLNKIPTSFIPPGNLFNDETVQILKENGYTHLSASLDTSQQPMIDGSFYHLPQTAETGTCESPCIVFDGVPYTKTLDDIKQSLDVHGYAIVMLHPQEFSVFEDGALQNEVNEAQIEELINLLDSISQEGFSTVSINEIRSDAHEIIPTTTQPDESCNCVAFRLDTVQDWWLSTINSDIIDKFNEKQHPLTIGIIGNFIGDDPNIVEKVRYSLENNSGVELANNGWNYEDFSNLSIDEQSNLLLQTDNVINDIFGIQSKVFIPPQSRHDQNTLDLLSKNDYSHISASVSFSEPPYSLNSQTLYRFPFTAYTGTFSSDNNRFEGVSSDVTFNDIQFSIDSYGFAVVMMSPQHFAVYENNEYLDQTDSSQLFQIDDLFAQLDDAGIIIVPISKINSSTVTLVLPDWIKNNAKWWTDDLISDTDFASGIEFMIQQNIIQIPNLSDSSSSSEDTIPRWVKNNADWWSQDLITDEDFVNGIQYLVENGIIQV